MMLSYRVPSHLCVRSAYLHFLAHRSAFSFASRCNTHPVVVDGEVCTIRGPTANLYRLQRFPYSAEKRKRYVNRKSQECILLILLCIFKFTCSIRESVEEAESAELGLLLCKAELYENAEAIKDTYS